MAKKRVSQTDLRKLMAQIKTSGAKDASGPGNKKYKLSSRELALMEEQKRDEERRKSREKEKKAAALASLPPVPDASAVPQKSILKNKASTPLVVQMPPPSFIPTPKQTVETSGSEEATATESTDQNVEPVQPIVDAGDQTSALPEGFFDDPVLDAKARNVQYVDAAEEEWDRFRKEIVDEINTAQDILVEDRNEATIDRQIEEIDDQMRAWHRVAEMEKKIELTNKLKQELPVKKIKKEESDDEDDDYEEFLDWRTKK